MKFFKSRLIQAAVITGLFTVLAALLARDSRPDLGSSDPGTQIKDVTVTTVATEQIPLSEIPGADLSEESSEIPQRGSVSTGSSSQRKEWSGQEVAQSVTPIRNIDALYYVASGHPLHISPLSTTISVDFRETLASRYIEVLVLAPNSPPINFPARRPGASVSLIVESASYDLTVTAIDWQNSRISISLLPKRGTR